MTLDAGTLSGWPENRSRRSTIVAQFGGDRADLLEWALNTGDPLADAVTARLFEDPARIRTQLDAGLKGGLTSVQNPDPTVAALLADAEQHAAYVDDAFLDTGTRPFHSMPPAVHIVSLSMGSLIRVYESPSIAAVLAGTGRLTTGAESRIRETGKWLGTVMLPGALRMGAPGYIGTLGVRMLHARVRYAAMRGGFADRQFGMAVNQVDLGRTWMDFTLTAWRAESMLGYGLTRLETAQLFKVWWHIGHLLGIDARLIEGISDLEQAARVDALFQAVTGPMIPEAQLLAKATIDTIKEELQTALRLPKPLGQRALSGLARRFHGNAVADDLSIPPAPITDPIISGAIELIQRNRTKTRNDPGKWEQMIEKNIVALEAQLAALSPQAEYEQGNS